MNLLYRPEHSYKYQLNKDRDRLVLKPGAKARFGGVEYLVDHDTLFGSEDDGYKEIQICLREFMQYPTGNMRFPRLLKNFTPHSIRRMEAVSNHAKLAVDELTELIELSKYYDEREQISRKKLKCKKRQIELFFNKLYKHRFLTIYL